ncbi:MAG: type IV secretion system protein [Novosphingobium sp.]
MAMCEQLAANASLGVAPALRAVDCLASETTAAAFGRLFGSDGALMPALTILLTLYIAFFGFSLLTGRSTLGISALTPRMMTLGLVLTFATSWIAYQSVVWNLAIGAPDQIASVITGSRGSATQIFADRIDIIFSAIAEVAQPGGGGAEGAVPQGGQGSFTPANLMWLGALLLLLGTVGVLVTARIALAVLLALGPVFLVFSLFGGTRGLTAGWLRGVVLTAVTPLFVVTGGGIVMELLIPVVAALRTLEGAVNGRAALALFMIASVHLALMIMVMKVAGSVVSGWQVFGLAPSREGNSETRSPQAPMLAAYSAGEATQPASAAGHSRQTLLANSVSTPASDAAPAAAGATASRVRRTVVTQHSAAAPQLSLPRLPSQRARGIGSRFRAEAPTRRELIR